MTDSITIALSKGRILDETLPLLKEAGIELVDDVDTAGAQILDDLWIMYQLADDGEIVTVGIVHCEIDGILYAETGSKSFCNGDFHVLNPGLYFSRVPPGGRTGL